MDSPKNREDNGKKWVFYEIVESLKSSLPLDFSVIEDIKFSYLFGFYDSSPRAS